MNKRIKKLIEQAMELVDPLAVEGNFGPRRLNEQKFAQLIVQECVSVINNRVTKVDPDDLIIELKEHFGVK